MRYIKERGEIEGCPSASIRLNNSNLMILNDSVVLLSDHIIREFLSIKFGIFQYCVFMPVSALFVVLIESSTDVSKLSFGAMLYFVLIMGQNVSITYCLYNIINFLRLINFVHPNYAKLFLVLKGLIGLLFWQSLVVIYLVPAPILQIICDFISLVFHIDQCRPIAFLSVLELIEYTLLGLVFFFTFNPNKLAQMILIDYKEVTTDPEHRKFVKTTCPFWKTRFPISTALKDALGFHDILLDFQNFNKVYKTDVYTEAEARIHNSNQKRINLKQRSRAEIENKDLLLKQPIVHFDDSVSYIKEDEVDGGLYNLNRQRRISKQSLNDAEEEISTGIDFEMSNEDEQLFEYARRIGGFGYRVIQDGHVELE